MKKVRIAKAHVSDRWLTAWLSDGRIILTPTDWYPRLANVNARARDNYAIVADGTALRWPDVDEDLSLAGMLEGRRGR